MSIMELGALGEFVGSIGVIATLIYLAVQIRQNTHSMDELAMTQSEQNWTAMFSDAQMRVVDSQYMPSIRIKVRS